MKYCVNTLAYPELEWEDVLKTSKEYGFEALEVRGIAREMDLRKIPCFAPENRAKSLELCKKYNIEVLSFCTSAGFHDPEVYAASIEECKHAIDLAVDFGAPYIRVFGKFVPDVNRYEEILSLVAQGFDEVAELGAQKGVMPLLETNYDFVSVDIIKSVFRRMKHKNFGIIWDLKNTYKVYGTEMMESFGFFRPYLKYVQVNDGVYNPETGKVDQCLIGDGEIPVPQVMALLQASNFDGYISLEWERHFLPHIAHYEVAFPSFMKYMSKILYQK